MSADHMLLPGNVEVYTGEPVVRRRVRSELAWSASALVGGDRLTFRTLSDDQATIRDGMPMIGSLPATNGIHFTFLLSLWRIARRCC
ncbi:MAG: hypothetical protein ACRDRH_27885 [Pseudonocardia sp.]